MRAPGLALGLALLLLAGSADAHRSSDAFLSLSAEGSALRGHWEIALRDVAVLADVDRDADRALTWGELRSAEPALREIVAGAIEVAGDGASCALTVGELLIRDRSDGAYAWFPLTSTCPAPIETLRITYRLLFDLDPSHRGFLAVRAGSAAHSAVFSPERPQLSLTLAEPSRARQFTDYLVEGVHHIWIGLDHVLFLLALLLPCVLRREGAAWQPQPALRPVFWEVVRVVTAFTLAHSVTLSLSALGVIALPVVWVESAIALSVMLAALNNVFPVVTRGRWAVALVFGLIHGFGFASVLGELGLPDGARLLALVAFNLGVEVGQLAIVLVAVPIVFALSRHRGYPLSMVAGSLAVTALALFWLVQRTGLLPV